MHPKTTSPPVDKKTVVKDYANILEQYALDYKYASPYYQVGEPGKIQGWILHLTCVWIDVAGLLSAILPLLVRQKVPFKVVQNRDKAIMLSNGDLGYNQLGKTFCIYYPNDAEMASFTRELLELTKTFKGCSIPTDFHLGGIVYTRYGSFNPKLFLDPSGRVERYIHDSNGQLIKDEYTTPFKFPKGIPWPFQEIKEPAEEVPTTFLKDTYKVFSTLKNDAKGRVMKSLRLNGFKIQWIIIKEAKQGVFADKNGRDNQDRLRWQHQLLQDLQGKIPVPKIYDFFEEKGNSYLVMEYVKGKSLQQVIADTYESSTWIDLDVKKKTLLIDHLLQLASTLDTLHKLGYIHRDVTGVNFILDRKNSFVAIDPELAYSINENTPDPPFVMGTQGYMSPEQMRVELPKAEQDIYSFGALMIDVFTNLGPVKFECQHPDLKDRLDFFIHNKRISHMVADCLSEAPADRPTLEKIKVHLADFRKDVSTTKTASPASSDLVNQTIGKLIRTLGAPVMIREDRIWHSYASDENELLANPQAGITYATGWFAGVSGVMHVLSKAKNAGHDIEMTRSAYSKGWEFLKANFLPSLPNVIPGLYYGAAGVALALSKGMEVGLIPEAEHKDTVEKCLNIPIVGSSIVHGVAGQGLAVLGCENHLTKNTKGRLLERCVNEALKNQQKNGSWLSSLPNTSRAVSNTGFSQGVAGTCYFLLKYYDQHKDEKVMQPILKALEWLRKRSRKSKSGIFWLKSDQDRMFDRWLNDGTTGVALCFIKAYEVLGDPSYKKIAENALKANPKYLVFPNFSLAHGLAGLAKTYLYAAKVFKDEEWQERADFLVNVLLQTCKGKDEHACYWIIEDNKSPTADYMVGNGGILGLMLAYQFPSSNCYEPPM